MKITEILKKKKNTFSVELVPPRNGEDINRLLEKLKLLKEIGINFISVTMGAGGSLRGGNLPICVKSKEIGIEPLAHFTCREKTKYEIENLLIDYSYLDIKNILALRGDPPAMDKQQEWQGDYKYAYLLVNQATAMNQGKYLARKGIDEGWFREGVKTDFCIGVAAHPEDKIEDEVKHLKTKIDSGAEFAITQMIFDKESYENYVNNVKKLNIPIIPGLRPLVKLKQAEGVEIFFSLKIPTDLKKGLKHSQNPENFGIKYIVKLINDLKDLGALGAHFFTLNDVGVVKKIIAEL